PLEAGEAPEIAIEADPFAAPLNCQRRKPCVADSRCAGISVDAQPAKDVPMPFARLNNLTVRLIDQVLTKPESIRNIARRLIKSSVRCDADHRAQHQWRQAKASITGND